MARPARFGSTISAVALASVIAGCATPFSRSGSSAKKMISGNVALATRANMALGAGDFVAAIDLAERAVANKPGDAFLRALLANAYFAAGRFASAEAAYRDTLTLYPAEPQVLLKLALVQIAQGKKDEALALLETAREIIEPTDYGLALALAGQPYEAVQVLEVAARSPGADARVRQNLALAHGLSGDWSAAETIAAQDLSPDQVGARVQQWMALSSSARASDQVAALVGVKPAASDPGQPVRLALRGSNNRVAQVQSTSIPVAPVAVAEAAPVQPAPAAQPVQAPAFAQPVAHVAPELAPQLPAQTPPSVVAAASGEGLEAAAPSSLAAMGEALIKGPAAYAAMVTDFVIPKPRPASAPKKQSPKPAASVERRSPASNAVVQLGAYSSPQRVSLAWQNFTQRHSELRKFAPLRARFDGPRGTVYRLSVKGFATVQEASGLCGALRQRGASCFVRRVSGDAPVRLASR